MYSVLLALGAAAVAFAVTAAAFSPLAGILPALLVFFLVGYLVFRQINGRLEGEMKVFADHMQDRRIDMATAKMHEIRARYGKWVPTLESQIDASLGLMEYGQAKFDAARPLLEAGRGANWMAEVALGCLHWRQGRKPDAWASFDAAAQRTPKEAMIYAVWATLRSRDGQRDEALAAVGKGIAALPTHPLLRQIQATLANKQKLDTKDFPQAWFQFFPEEMMLKMRAEQQPTVVPVPHPGAPRFGGRPAPRR